jgi:glycosyltransferase involved in cell wall biosynthesis
VTSAAKPAAPARQYLDASAGRRLVFLNWRDLAHPQAGGAELFCQSVAERFAAAGARVTLLTAQPGGLPPAETVRGVEIRRRGGTFGVYPAALARLAAAARAGGIDAVVDCQNGIPFFSPLVVGSSIPVVQVLHHAHQHQFPLYFPAPVARMGQLLESPGSRWVYRRRPVAVVSPSTRDSARTVLALPGPRYLVPNGVSAPRTGTPRPPAPRPTIVCVGRLVPHKRLHLLLDALPALTAAHPGLTVHIVGDGPDRNRLHAHAAGLGVDQGDGASGAILRWHGYTDAATRDGLLATAWLTVNPSHGEGWGLSVLEANSHGVPAVAFRVPGLRDAVRDGYTGWLVDTGQPLGAVVDNALRLLADPAQAARRRDAARAWAAGFSWDAGAELLARVIDAETARLAVRQAARRAGGRRAGRDRRRLDDQVTRAEFTLAPGAPLPTLRRTDIVYRGLRPAADGGPVAVALCYGANGVGARLGLARAGIMRGVVVRPASGEDLLLAAGHVDPSASPVAAQPATATAG